MKRLRTIHVTGMQLKGAIQLGEQAIPWNHVDCAGMVQEPQLGQDVYSIVVESCKPGEMTTEICTVVYTGREHDTQRVLERIWDEICMNAQQAAGYTFVNPGGIVTELVGMKAVKESEHADED